ncbi:MAG TPA: hypothetical protein VG604_01420 [Candidatus Saccharimonadales bacterium]|nr:hypothetical protein [Candidatus Saccharimonadales bacterium]
MAIETTVVRTGRHTAHTLQAARKAGLDVISNEIKPTTEQEETDIA